MVEKPRGPYQRGTTGRHEEYVRSSSQAGRYGCWYLVRPRTLSNVSGWSFSQSFLKEAGLLVLSWSQMPVETPDRSGSPLLETKISNRIILFKYDSPATNATSWDDLLRSYQDFALKNQNINQTKTDYVLLFFEKRWPVEQDATYLNACHISLLLRKLLKASFQAVNERIGLCVCQ